MAPDLKLGKGITLVVAKSKNYLTANHEILEYILKGKKNYCVYLSLNKSAATIQKLLESKGGSLDKIILIDCVTKLASSNVERSGNIIFVDSPENLTEIGIVVEGAANSVKGKPTYLFLDSVSTLLLYSKAQTVTKFIHFLTVLIRDLDMSGVILSVEEKGENEQVVSTISQFCDARLDI